MPGELIRAVASPLEVAQVRALFEAYAAELGVSLCFQGFDRELATLPGAYAPPRGALWLAGPAGAPCGCVALRPLARASCAAVADAAVADAAVADVAVADAAATDVAANDFAVADVAELKRLYVHPAARGSGLGRRLAERAIAHARALGYHTIKLDTLAHMDAARALYADLGFRPCAAYYRNPLGGTLYMELAL